jgi:hypothetical protein
VITVQSALLRELLFWAPSPIQLELTGATSQGAQACPVDLRFAARRAGVFCLEGPVHSLHPDGMQGLGQLRWAAEEAELRLSLFATDPPFRCWLGRSTAAGGAIFPAGAEFTGGWQDESQRQLTLRLDYRHALRAVRAGTSA